MRRTTLAVLAASTCAASVGTAQVDPYRGHSVVRVDIRTAEQLAAIETLSPDYWTHGVGIGPVEMRLSPQNLATLNFLGIPYEVMIVDVQALVDAERDRLALGGRELGSWYDDYKMLAEHEQRWQDLAAAHPGLVAIETFGQSLEGRDMMGLKISSGGGGTRPIILINGGQHAREWVSPMVVTGLAEHLITQHAAGNPRVVDILSKVDFWIAPIMNPDGYEFTWTAGQRLWRKNRRDNGGGCFGVDLNRNWEVGWSAPFGGSSGNPCNDTYRGTAAWSEPETAAFRAWTIGHAQRVAVHIDTHSYGQLVLSPWGYQTTPPDDLGVFDWLGGLQADAIFSVDGAEYVFGQGATVLYIASGSAKDFGYDLLQSLAWTIELRPENASQGGFILDPAEIIPNRDEYIEGILALAEKVSEPMWVRFEGQAPATVGSNETLDILVQVTERISTYAPGTATLHYRTSSGAFTEVPMVDTGSLVFRGSVPAQDCGDVIELFVTAETSSGDVIRAPESGAISVDVTDSIATAFDDCETNTGWVVGAPGDTATSGVWNRMDPEGTQAQPEDDHTPGGTDCWVTDGVAGQGVGSRDIDGGATTLTSPAFDATEPWDIIGEAYVTYHRWYSNNAGNAPNQDSMPVSISDDGGQTWVLLEDVEENAGAWVRKSFRIADYVTPGADIRLRFVARDEGEGSIVEAGVDDVDITFVGCARHPADFNKDGMLDIFDFLAFQDLFTMQDPRADLDQSTGVGVFDIFDFLRFQDLFVG